MSVLRAEINSGPPPPLRCLPGLRASLLLRWSEKDTGIHPAISLAARQARKTLLMGLVGAVAGIAELRVLNAPWVIRSRRLRADESSKDYGAQHKLRLAHDPISHARCTRRDFTVIKAWKASLFRGRGHKNRNVGVAPPVLLTGDVCFRRRFASVPLAVEMARQRGRSRSVWFSGSFHCWAVGGSLRSSLSATDEITKQITPNKLNHWISRDLRLWLDADLGGDRSDVC